VRSSLILSFLVASFMTLSSSAYAEDLEGVVVSVGSALNTSVMLTKENEPKGPKLCYDDVGKRVRKLSAMTVKVTGNWKTNDKGAKTCFEASDFTVLKTSSGRDAVVGTLGEKSGVYQVTGGDGKVLKLGEVTSGLKKLNGQKVILDLKSMESPNAKEPTYKVVTYAAFP
jgi:hypothetical protein